MNQKAILVSLFSVIVLVLALNLVSASLVTFTDVEVNGMTVDGGETVGIFGGENIPIEVEFEALDDASDVRVNVEMLGYRSDIEDQTERFDIVDGSRYRKRLSLQIPDDLDPTEEYTLYVTVESKTQKDELGFSLRIQRESFVIEILSADVSGGVTAGSSGYVDVVIKNRGFQRLDDVYVRVSSDELGISEKAYFGDLTPLDDCKIEEVEGDLVIIDCDDDNEDAYERRVYFTVPSSAASGVYNLKVEAYNDDTKVSETETLVVSGSEQISEVMVPVTSKEVSTNGEVTYDVIIVNRGTGLGIYEIIPESVDNLAVSVDSPIVTVQGGSSATVKVRVKASNVQGSYAFGVLVESDGELVQRSTLQTIVSGSGASVDSVVVLTIVLVIVFVVLLIVLVVLLTRKPKREEEFGESYY
ncbi:MAG: hypothetical protein ABIE22_03885 [archaeon]